MADGNPRYEDLPRPESVAFFMERLSGHKMVKNFNEPQTQIFVVERDKRDTLTIYLTNIYIVSEANVFDVQRRHPGVNCIVTISAWNRYTDEAKEVAKGQGIGLFRLSEFMGALYYDKQRFLDYVTPEKPSGSWGKT